jgi:hypothetical protein
MDAFTGLCVLGSVKVHDGSLNAEGVTCSGFSLFLLSSLLKVTSVWRVGHGPTREVLLLQRGASSRSKLGQSVGYQLPLVLKKA